MSEPLRRGMAKYWLLEGGWGVAAVAAVTAVSLLLQRVTGYWAISLVYLLSVVLLALVLSRWVVLLVATLSAVLWNFLFIPPRFTFRIAAPEDAMMFGMYFLVAVVMGHLTNQLREREAAERRREQRASALNRLLQSLAASASLEEGLALAVAEVDALFGAHTAIVIDGSADMPDATLRLSVNTSKSKFGEMKMRFPGRRSLTPNEHELLETFASQIAVFIERHRLIETAQQARMAEESERLHRTLLDSVSHELKTPLAVISAATEGLDTQLKGAGLPLSETFLDEIKAANRRLNRIVTNLLDMTRIDSGRLPLSAEWGEARELLESAVSQVENEVSRARVRISVADDLPLVELDFGLMEQALCNLLVNAAEYSPASAPIEMSAQLDDRTLQLRVRDHGAGLAAGEEKRVFEKFYRGSGARPGGTGLGLSIVQGIARAHRGGAEAENDPAGGAVFTIRVPVETAKRPA
jgi:two-component system sensor histidine kinase KdpD